MENNKLTIQRINGDFTVCKVSDYARVNWNAEYFFIGKTDRENSLVCLTEDVPPNTTEREDGWRAFRVEGVLDFSLTGILSRIAAPLAEVGIAIFAVSTFNTDYVLVKKEHEMKALNHLAQAGFVISTGDAYSDYFINRSASDIMQEYGKQHDEWEFVTSTRL